MVRPRRQRRLRLRLRASYFKPQGIPMRELEVIDLLAEEAEALRLKHIKKLDQIDAAKEMGVSQSTFQRMLTIAHEKVSRGLIEGKAIKIEEKCED